MDADRVAQRALELHDNASMPLVEALTLALNEAAGPIWPCAKLAIRDGKVTTESHQYAPGLPDGEHDVYPMPVDTDAAPTLAPCAMEALRNLANAFHEGRALPVDARSEGYVYSLIHAAERVIAGEPPMQSQPRAEALRGLRNLKVLLGTDSPEVRGWAPAVQQAAQKAINAAIRALSDAFGVPVDPKRVAEGSNSKQESAQ